MHFFKILRISYMVRTWWKHGGDMVGHGGHCFSKILGHGE